MPIVCEGPIAALADRFVDLGLGEESMHPIDQPASRGLDPVAIGSTARQLEAAKALHLRSLSRRRLILVAGLGK
jgi:hypothetical protein